MVTGSPLEEECVGFDVDFLEETIVDPPVWGTVDWRKVVGDDLVDGD